MKCYAIGVFFLTVTSQDFQIPNIGNILENLPDLGNIDLGNIDLGNLDLGNIDLGNIDLGDLDLGNIDLGNSDLENINQSECKPIYKNTKKKNPYLIQIC